ncbi:hypothetical protein SAMN05444365_103310 [Micromonospora pattaloongensis]|uniref:PknH-like extracellular domain-containing protein n=1 Tax=Micromonospora pattaloongensis TaxID=405436 RepID=A0A1H3MCV7_9ACTN|nr:hypothetical protein [Micromonospora pattaloongensis]SDY74019.1 hypothetical protein SAMN05444365_103310 [Micromonospora pattaloongensis]
MPAPSRLTRTLLLCAAAGTLIAGAGCQTLDDAGQVIGRADLVNDLAARLDHSGELTYAADYQLAGAATATIARTPQPPRSAYIYPGGRVIVTDEGTTECRGAGTGSTCTVTPPPSPGARPPATVFADAAQQGLVTPTVVIGLLTAAALDADAIIKQHDTTIAGRHATCVQVQQVKNAAASSFDACITTDGVLGSFAGVVGGKHVDIAMSRYRESVDAAAFEPPGDARIVDRRAGAAR